MLDLAELVSDVVVELCGDAGLGLGQRVAVGVVGIRHILAAAEVVGDRVQSADGVVGVGQVLRDGGSAELDFPVR